MGKWKGAKWAWGMGGRSAGHAHRLWLLFLPLANRFNYILYQAGGDFPGHQPPRFFCDKKHVGRTPPPSPMMRSKSINHAYKGPDRPSGPVFINQHWSGNPGIFRNSAVIPQEPPLPARAPWCTPGRIGLQSPTRTPNALSAGPRPRASFEPALFRLHGRFGFLPYCDPAAPLLLHKADIIRRPMGYYF